MRICRKSKTALHGCRPNRWREASQGRQAEWRIANRIAAAAAIMINTAKKIPGFIEVSVHRALGMPKLFWRSNSKEGDLAFRIEFQNSDDNAVARAIRDRGSLAGRLNVH